VEERDRAGEVTGLGQEGRGVGRTGLPPRLARHELEGEVGAAGAPGPAGLPAARGIEVAEVERPGDARMLDPREDLELPPEALGPLAAGIHGEDLEGDLPAEVEVPHEEHAAHAAAPQVPDPFVAWSQVDGVTHFGRTL
jgi:hypothetical protein